MDSDRQIGGINMKYLFLDLDEGFGFKTDEVHEILETDIPISDEIYNRFFELQSQGKKFRIKNINGSTFEEIFEEVIPETIDPSTLPKSKMQLLQEQIDTLALQILDMMGV